MGVDDGDAPFFLLQMLQGGNQGKVLDDIGMVAGVKGVSITEHALMVTPPPPQMPKNPCKTTILSFRIEGFAAH
jgi:hypothetical protein